MLLWSTVASAFKLSLEHLEPAQLLLVAATVSLVVLCAILAARGRLRLLFSFTRRQYAFSALMGFMNPALYYMVLFEAYDRLAAQEAQALNYTWALALALLSVPLLKQRLTVRDAVAGLVCYGGAFVTATRGNVSSFDPSNAVGVALALGSAFIWALYWILNTRDDRDPVAGQALNFAFGLPWIVVACAIGVGFDVRDWRGLFGGAYVGLFEMGITFVVWSSALKLTRSAARIGNLIFISPFLSLVLIRYVVGEPIAQSTVVGLALIVGGLLLQQTAGRPAPARSS